MAKLVPTALMLALAIILLDGCATPPGAAPAQTAAQFKAATPAAADLARVYLLPTNSKGMFVDIKGYARLTLFPDGSNRGATLGSVADGSFLAFDIAPGAYDVVADTSEPFTKIAQSMEFAAGTTYFLRPVFYRSATEVGRQWNGKPGSGMGFETVEAAAATREIAALSMAEITPEGTAFLTRTAQPRAAAAPPPPPPPPPPPAATAAPASAPAPAPARMAAPPVAAAPAAPNAFDVLERKLGELKRLRQENLITQQDYDAKKKALLENY